MTEPLGFLRRGRDRMLEMLARADMCPPGFVEQQRDTWHGYHNAERCADADDAAEQRAGDDTRPR